MKNLVAMISIGSRPWALMAFKTFESYYKDNNFVDTVLVDEYFEGFCEKFSVNSSLEGGRKNKEAYAFKSFVAWYYIKKHGYDRVLVVDDSCSLNPRAPDIFLCAPPQWMAYTVTTEAHARSSYEFIKGCPEVEDVGYFPEKYANSGVVLYDKSSVDVFSLENINSFSSLFFASFPHQTFFYYIMSKYRVPGVRLDKKFNSIPGVYLKGVERKELKDPVPYLDDIFISHVTGAFKYRRKVIDECSRYYLSLASVCT